MKKMRRIFNNKNNHLSMVLTQIDMHKISIRELVIAVLLYTCTFVNIVCIQNIIKTVF